MKDRENYFTGTPADFVFEGPSDAVLRATVVEESGDLVLHGPGGSKRLTKGTATHARYAGYLRDRGIEPLPEVVEVDACTGFGLRATSKDSTI